MSSVSGDSEDGVSRKKIKLSDEEEVTGDHSVAEDLSAHVRLNSLEGFQLSEVLSENSYSKSVFLEGRFDKAADKAIILLEKLPIHHDSVEKLLNNADLALNLKSNSISEPNVVDYACYPPVCQGDIKATVIYPATNKHAEKYKYQSSVVVNETAEIYKSVVLPHLEAQKFSIQWVYNILEHKSEADRIIFEDPDPQLGFVLLPDLKWDEGEKSSIYLIAICHTRDIKSIRDLNASHLPLLKNIRRKALDAILKKYNIPSEKLRVFLHYQPSYYHLHVHFTSINKQVPGCQFEKARLLDTVISNIELLATYYQDVTLTYTLKSNDPLLSILKKASVISS
ncbi:m7GpppX diphosphatase-like [Argiope bruennichi]|uniref:m7GpppX diphosphatase n=1 Tax=Argiope bruennichi TaxID=94029 RepID=A0A8T0ENC4_ARGBR|nr:m7GpppX diphosphatase-like [Argiope bruennichi]KAF8776784.1 m7GpppX diphosphatase like protein [Argiope bruennichi]